MTTTHEFPPMLRGDRTAAPDGPAGLFLESRERAAALPVSCQQIREPLQLPTEVQRHDKAL